MKGFSMQTQKRKPRLVIYGPAQPGESTEYAAEVGKSGRPVYADNPEHGPTSAYAYQRCGGGRRVLRRGSDY
jgi:hypothetical protein